MDSLKHTLVLGCVKQIHDFHLSISLPDGHVGKVLIQHIGDSYSNQLQQLASGSQSVNSLEVASLSELFFVGQMVRCYVLDGPDSFISASDTHLGKRARQLSLNPRLVNQFVPSHQLHVHMCIHAVVYSVEDHGYLLDWGHLGDTTAGKIASSIIQHKLLFLKEKDAEDLKRQLAFFHSSGNTDVAARLKVGQLVPIIMNTDTIRSLKTNTIRPLRVTATVHAVKDTILAQTDVKSLHFGCILPGMWLQVRSSINKESGDANEDDDEEEENDDEEELKPKKKSSKPTDFKFYFKDLTILVKHKFMDKKCSSESEFPTVCVVSVDPTAKLIYGTTLSHFLPPQEDLQTCSTLPLSCISKDSVGHMHQLIGTVFDDARISSIFSNQLCITLPPPYSSVTAVVHKREVSDEKMVKPLREAFQKKQTVKCRIVDRDLLLNLVTASLRNSVLAKPFLKFEDIRAGDLVHATVIRHANGGIVCGFDKMKIRALLPYMHAVDGPYQAAGKTDARNNKVLMKYPLQSEVTCRILSVDMAKRKIILTAKKKFVDKNLQPILHRDQLTPGSVVEGFVGDILPYGVLVVFFNNIKGLVHISELGVDASNAVEDLFYRGQVVKTRIVNYNADADKLQLTFQLTSSQKTPLDPAMTKRLTQMHLLFRVGKTYPATVEEKSADGFFVTLEATGSPTGESQEPPNKKQRMTDSAMKVVHMRALLPFGHLTDFIGNIDAIADTIEVGQPLPRPVLLVQWGYTPLVSLKPSLLLAVTKESANMDDPAAVLSPLVNFCLDTADTDLSNAVGRQYIGWVRNVSCPHGVFVDFGGHMRGLAPSKLLPAPLSVIEGHQLLRPHQTVELKVVEVSGDDIGRDAPSSKTHHHRRSLVSLRLSDVASSFTRHPQFYLYGLLESALLERRNLIKTVSKAKKLSSLPKVGDVVVMKIVKFSPQLGAVGKLISSKSKAGALKAVCTLPHLSELQTAIASGQVTQSLGEESTTELCSGQQWNAVVLHLEVDSADISVEVSLDPWLVKVCQQRPTLTAKQSMVQVGQRVESQVLLPKMHGVLVALLGHGAGLLAYVPSMRHWNDLSHINDFIVGQKNKVVIHKICEDGTIIANLSIHEPLKALCSVKYAHSENSEVLPGDVDQSESLVGETVDVEISEVLDLQLNVIVSRPTGRSRRGRIFISEIYPSSYVSSLTVGHHPLYENFKKGQHLSARVIGERLGVKDKSFAPLSGMTCLELTLKESEKEEPSDPKCPKNFAFFQSIRRDGRYAFLLNQSDHPLVVVPVSNLGCTRNDVMSVRNSLTKPGIVVEGQVVLK